VRPLLKISLSSLPHGNLQAHWLTPAQDRSKLSETDFWCDFEWQKPIRKYLQ
jgi:hypothetical protein